MGGCLRAVPPSVDIIVVLVLYKLEYYSSKQNKYINIQIYK